MGVRTDTMQTTSIHHWYLASSGGFVTSCAHPVRADVHRVSHSRKPVQKYKSPLASGLKKCETQIADEQHDYKKPLLLMWADVEIYHF